MNHENRLIAALTRFHQKNEQCHRELLKEIKISELKLKQLHYLEIIHSNEQLTFGRFAEILRITKPSVTSIVNQLIRLECVYKRQCPRDGRIRYVELSDKGRKIVRFKILERQRLARKIIEALTDDEIEQFIRLIDRIISA